METSYTRSRSNSEYSQTSSSYQDDESLGGSSGAEEKKKSDLWSSCESIEPAIDENFKSKRTNPIDSNPYLKGCIIDTAARVLFPVTLPVYLGVKFYTKIREPDFFLCVAQHKFDKADSILKTTPQALNEIWKGKKVVHFIVGTDDEDSIKYLDQKNADFNALDKNFNAPIFIAASQNKLLSLDTIAKLSNTDLTFTHQTSQKTVFHIVAEKNHVQACSILIKHAKNKKVFSDVANNVDITGRTAIIISLEQQHLQIFSRLVQVKGIDLTCTHPNSGKSILHMLAEENNIPEFTTAIDQLKKQGVLKDIIDQQDGLGRTAVFIAAEKNNYFILKKLIESGASFSSPLTSRAITPYDASPKIACRNDSRKILWNAMHGNIKLVQELEDDDGIESQKSQALLLSIQELNYDQAKKLLLEGVSPNIKDERGNTLSMVVIKSRKSEEEKLELIKLLREKGDEISTPNANKEGLLTIAAKKGYYSIVKELTTDYEEESQNIDLDYQDKLGNTSLHYAVEKGNKKSVNRLLKMGALVGTANNIGQTPLHKAQDREIADLLIRYGADSSVVDKQGRKPLFYISRTDASNQVGKAVLSADPDMKTHEIAEIHGNKELAKLARAHEKGEVTEEDTLPKHEQKSDSPLGFAKDIKSQGADQLQTLSKKTLKEVGDAVDEIKTEGVTTLKDTAKGAIKAVDLPGKTADFVGSVASAAFDKAKEKALKALAPENKSDKTDD